MNKKFGGGRLDAPDKFLKCCKKNKTCYNSDMLYHYYYGVCMKKCAFTLAEVLITLGIIGVVAAMTLPSLIANHREKQTVVQLKKVYAALSNAYVSALDEYGTPADWGLPPKSQSGCGQVFMDKFGKYLQFAKQCGVSGDGCYPKKLLSISGAVDSSDTILNDNLVSRSVLSDGAAIALKVWDINCYKEHDICAFFEVDVNGLKKPNQYGRDVFRFYVTPKTIIPYGSQIWTGSQSFANACLKGGSGCTGWVLTNENMDYLHCPDKLGWDKAKSCKE